MGEQLDHVVHNSLDVPEIKEPVEVDRSLARPQQPAAAEIGDRVVLRAPPPPGQLHVEDTGHQFLEDMLGEFEILLAMRDVELEIGAAGAAFEVYGAAKGSIRPRVWAIAEGGYGYLGSTSLEMSPDAGQGPQRPVAVDLGSLSLSGPYLRVSAAVGF